jgi:hypothetical protein
LAEVADPPVWTPPTTRRYAKRPDNGHDWQRLRRFTPSEMNLFHAEVDAIKAAHNGIDEVKLCHVPSIFVLASNWRRSRS